ncbi:uroporphyrinogen-III synthase [uncultured Tateyamaria sp.]|uniref:uroporphyrinogen-III synthase n=1 Tax=uncultured Tateyamaria sp. TaxID=455651 RepID=UPI00262968F2|nr:uroporphyrinogen-III synthase [uncultured Tateyamaria sp.]
MILTRPIDAAQAFFAGLEPAVQSRLLPVFSPLIDIVPTPAEVEMDATDAAVFTSANGVRHGPSGDGRVAYCVGPATTEVARYHGWDAQQVGTDAQSLVASLIRMAPRARLHHLAGAHRRGQVVEHLSAAGLNITGVVVYDQRLVALSDKARDVIRRENKVIVPLFSPRTAQQFANTAPRATSIHVVAISAAVAEGMTAVAQDRVFVARAPNASAMGDAIAELL